MVKVLVEKLLRNIVSIVVLHREKSRNAAPGRSGASPAPQKQRMPGRTYVVGRLGDIGESGNRHDDGCELKCARDL